MEEKKQNDTEIDVGMIEKVEYCISRNGVCYDCKYCTETYKVSTCAILHDSENLFNLIHRLQSKIERLSLIAGIVDKGVAVEIVNMQETIDNQKEEIERLTEEKKTLVWLNQDLKKQVDEWKTECQELHDECENCWANKKLNSKQAVKDTAKEIFEWLKSKVIMTEIPHGSEPCEEDVEAVMWWQIEEYFKKKYDVKVE